MKPIFVSHKSGYFINHVIRAFLVLSCYGMILYAMSSCSASEPRKSTKAGVYSATVPESYLLTLPAHLGKNALENAIQNKLNGYGSRETGSRCGLKSLSTIGESLLAEASALRSGFAGGSDLNPASTLGASAPQTKVWHMQLSGCLGNEEAEDSLRDLVQTIDPGAQMRKETIESLPDEISGKVYSSGFASSEGVLPGDPLMQQSWHFSNVHQSDACADLENLVSSNSDREAREIVVAVIDTGIDTDHPDLKDNLYRRGGIIQGANFVGKGPEGEPDRAFEDVKGHGSHVAGIIAASGGNGLGIAGVSFCRGLEQKVKIMPVKALDDEGKGRTIELMRAIEWAVMNGADVLNLSFGHRSFYEERRQDFSDAFYDSVAEIGVAMFASAGNSGHENDTYVEVIIDDEPIQGYVYHFPSSYNATISVAASNAENQLTGFSVRGLGVDIAAPGANIISTIPGGDWAAKSGTSMAAPVMSGLYALGLSYQMTDQPATRANLQDLMFDSVSGRLAEESASNELLPVNTGGIVQAPQLIGAIANGN